MPITELEQAEALSYLYQWLKNHPKYGTLAPPQQPDTLFYNDVSTPIGLATFVLKFYMCDNCGFVKPNDVCNNS